MPSLLTKIERVPVDSLTLYPGNPRVGNIDAIAESLRENQQYAPLVVQASTRHVLAGNHTLKAARKLGWAEVDVVLVDVDDPQAARIVLSANRTADLGGYDDDALAQLLASLDGDYAGTGYTPEDLDALSGLDALPEPGDAPAEEEPPPVWGVIVECDDETQQTEVLARLAGDGFTVRALIG
jgi:ParB-like chromosome segregation protein Spo0J